MMDVDGWEYVPLMNNTFVVSLEVCVRMHVELAKSLFNQHL